MSVPSAEIAAIERDLLSTDEAVQRAVLTKLQSATEMTKYLRYGKVLAALFVALRRGGSPLLPTSIAGMTLNVLSALNDVYRSRHQAAEQAMASLPPMFRSAGAAPAPFLDDPFGPLLKLCEAMLVQGLTWLPKVAAITLEIDRAVYLKVRVIQHEANSTPGSYSPIPSLTPVQDVYRQLERRFTDAVDGGKQAEATQWAYALSMFLIRRIDPDTECAHTFEFLESFTRLASFCLQGPPKDVYSAYGTSTHGGCMALAWSRQLRTLTQGCPSWYPRLAAHGLGEDPERLVRHLHKLLRVVAKAEREGRLGPHGHPDYRAASEDSLQHLFYHIAHIVDFELVPPSFAIQIPGLFDLVVKYLLDPKTSEPLLPALVTLLYVLCRDEACLAQFKEVCGLERQLGAFSRRLMASPNDALMGQVVALACVMGKMGWRNPVMGKAELGMTVPMMVMSMESTAASFGRSHADNTSLTEPNFFDRVSDALDHAARGCIPSPCSGVLQHHVKGVAFNQHYRGYYPLGCLLRFCKALERVQTAAAARGTRAVIQELEAAKPEQDARKARIWARAMQGGEATEGDGGAGPSNSSGGTGTLAAPPATAPSESVGSEGAGVEAEAPGQGKKPSSRRKAAGVAPQCGWCKKEPEEGEKLKLCAGCRSVRFCSVKCQKQAWKEGHAAECKRIQAESAGGEQD